MLNPLNERELGLLKEELNTCTHLKQYLEKSLGEIDRGLRTQQPPYLYHYQGAAQLLEELLSISTTPITR
jgi:hypothetical protein